MGTSLSTEQSWRRKVTGGISQKSYIGSRTFSKTYISGDAIDLELELEVSSKMNKPSLQRSESAKVFSNNKGSASVSKWTSTRSTSVNLTNNHCEGFEDIAIKSLESMRERLCVDGNCTLKSRMDSEIYPEVLETLLLHKSSKRVLIKVCYVLAAASTNGFCSSYSKVLSKINTEMVKAISKLTEDIGITSEFFETAYCLCLACIENKDDYGTDAMVEIIHSVLQIQNLSDIILIQICNFLHLVSENHTQNQTIFGTETLQQILVQYLKSSSSSSYGLSDSSNDNNVLLSIFNGISSLCEQHLQNQTLFGSIEIIHLIDRLLQSDNNNSDPSLLSALCSMSTLLTTNHSINKHSFSIHQIHISALNLLINHFQTYDEEVIVNIFSLIISIGFENSMIQNQCFQLSFDSLITILCDHVNSETVVSHCMGVLSALVVKNKINQRRIGTSSNIFEILNQIFERYAPATAPTATTIVAATTTTITTSVVVMKSMCELVWAMAANHTSNRQQLLKMDIHKRLYLLLCTFPEQSDMIRVVFGAIWSVTHETDNTTINNIDRAITDSNTDSKTNSNDNPRASNLPLITLTEGNILLFLSILNSHRTVASVVEQGLWVFQKYCVMSEASQSLLAKNGGCQLLLDLLKIHSSVVEVVTVGTSAIWFFILKNERNCQLFGEMNGGCELLVSLLGVYSSNELIVRTVCGSVWTIAVMNKGCCVRFRSADIVPLLHNVIKKFSGNTNTINVARGALELVLSV